MKKIVTLFFLTCIYVVLPATAQSVQWADKVLEFSSQLTPIQYAAAQALGKPSVLPAGGQNPGAWSPAKPNRNEFLKLGFPNPMNVQQVAIAESYNPSALYRVLLYDEAGREYEVYTLNPGAKPLRSRMLNIFIDKTLYRVAAVKLEFDGSAVSDMYGIDAVAISDSNYPVLAFVPIPELLADDIIVEELDANVNSQHSELNPLLSPDGKTMYFSRRNHPQNTGGVKDKEDIWYSQLGTDGKWQLAMNMGRPFNNEDPNFINSISSMTPDGKATMLLGNHYEGDKRMTAGVSISTLENGKWTDPVPVNIANDYNLNDRANYFLASSRKVILMSVQRRDSEGDRDLYVSFAEDNNQWSEPLNLGKTLNTVADESAPFLMDDERTLYFSSNGFSGYGGADIYVTERLDDTWTNWSEPRNLGPRINSPGDDLFFNIPNASDYAYYSRQVSENNFNIFRTRLPIYKQPEIWVTVKGTLVDANTGKPLEALIIAEVLADGKRVGETSVKSGEYEISLRAGERYSLRAEAGNHISESQTIDLRNIASNKVLENQNFSLQPIRITAIGPGATIRLNNIFFEYNKSDLLPESQTELNRLVDLMIEERPGMTVEVSGHTDNIGSASFNLALSRRRANSAKAYLVSKGVEAKRITTIGYGLSRPIASNDTEENGRALNRRVEFRIISE
ncbi:MAG: OmpA family protein [Cyclobacteriaceae bacterium]|jgi:outer membrane protein OmpA-like peptidoglycan-associated protein|nr:OmpA family protein [Cyclobacteriaceae bacterium]